jgi:hypothetical protein
MHTDMQLLESINMNPKVAKMKLTKHQLDDVLVAIGQSMREIAYAKPGHPGFLKRKVGGWLVIEENGYNVPNVNLSHAFMNDVIVDQKKQVLTFMNKRADDDEKTGAVWVENGVKIDVRTHVPKCASHLFT